MSIIFLVGFMGCGKSYTARNLSGILGIPFLDMDREIEELADLSVSEIFEKYGEAYFRKQERLYLENLDANRNLILSTGGGAPCFGDNMDLMNQKGLTVFLNRSKALAIPQLLKGKHKRPMLAGKTDEEIEQFYNQKLAERLPFYEKAQIKTGDSDTEEIAEMIKKVIGDSF